MIKINQKEIFALVDCNNFYASCERVFNPTLKNVPVVILSNNDGCAVSMSNEAKALGIEIGTPVFQVQNLIKKHNVQVFSSNYSLYGDMSSRVMNVLSSFSPEIEIYSIDECFLRLDGFSKNLKEYGIEIKKRVEKYTGIPVSVGIARTKTLAKLANRIAKKNPIYKGVLDINQFDEKKTDDLLFKISVDDVWGIGYQKAKKLKKFRIYNALQLKKSQELMIHKNLGGIVGLRILWELRGISCIPLEMITPNRKQIVCSRSFGKPVANIEGLFQALSAYTTRAAEKLRTEHSVATVIHLFLGTNRFKKEPQYHKNASLNLPNPTAYTSELIHYALFLLKQIYKTGYKYKKIGVMLCELMPEKDVPTDLFTEKEKEKKRKLMKSIDKINIQYGKDTIRLGSEGFEHKWAMRRSYLSKRFTTQWKEILEVHI